MVFLPGIRSPELWILQSSPKVTIKIKCVALISTLSSISGVDCTIDDMVKKMTTHICGTKRVMWWTPEGEENKIIFYFFKEQARKAHSSAFCIDLHRQTLMAMMGNDDNDGQ